MCFQWNPCDKKVFRGQISTDMFCKKVPVDMLLSVPVDMVLSVPVDMLLSVPVDAFIRRWEVAVKTDCTHSMHTFNVAYTRGRPNIWSVKYLAI